MKNSTLSPNLLLSLIQEMLRSEVELDTFCLDHFSELYRSFPRGMNIIEKQKRLATNVDLDILVSTLYQADPILFHRSEHQIQHAVQHIEVNVSTLRRAIIELCPEDGTLQAFILDYFPKVARQLSQGMARDEKLNQLFSRSTKVEIIQELRKYIWHSSIPTLKQANSQASDSINSNLSDPHDVPSTFVSGTVEQDIAGKTNSSAGVTSDGLESLVPSPPLEVPKKVGQGLNFSHPMNIECPALRAESYADVLADLFRTAKGEVCFALFGHWGRGKTFLAKKLEKSLTKRNYACIWFSAWRYRNKPELWAHLYETIREQFTKEPVLLRIPMIFRGRWSEDGGVSGIILLLLALGFAFTPFLKIVWLAWTLASLLGIIGFVKIATAIWKSRANLTSFYKRYMIVARHIDKLGLQATLGEDLKLLLSGWLGGPQKSFGSRLGTFALYSIAAGLLLASLWVALAPAPPSPLAQFLKRELESRGVNLWAPDAGLRLCIVGAIALVLIMFSFWLRATVPIWQWWRWRSIGERRVLLIVDDLDRMQEQESLDVIEQLKLFLEQDGLQHRLQVLMICEEDSLRTAIVAKYQRSRPPALHASGADQEQNDSGNSHRLCESTLQKLFIASLRLPPLSVSEQHEFLDSLISIPGPAVGMAHASAHKIHLTDGPPSVALAPAAQPTQIPDKVGAEVSESPTLSPMQASIQPRVSQEADTDLTTDETQALHSVLGTLVDESSAWSPVGPRALASFVFRYKLARRLLTARNRLLAPEMVARQLALHLANPHDSKRIMIGSDLRAVLNEVL